MNTDKLIEIRFWHRLAEFVSNVQVNDPCSQEEKDMILNVCTLMENKVEAE